MRTLRLCLVFLFLTTGVAFAGAENKDAAEQAAIKKTIESYVKAFNDRDAKALAAHWTKDGSFVTPVGAGFVGRDKLEAAFREFFEKNKTIKLKVTSLAIYVTSPKKVVEEGVAATTRPGEEPELTRYVAEYVKNSDGWKIARLKEVVPLNTSTHHEKLKPLGWLVGDWVDKDATGKVATRCFWSANGNFLVRNYSLTVGGRIAFGGKQIIGWDPASKKIRSWVFDSNGGVGEGTWTKKGNKWFVMSTIILSTGKKASSTNIVTPVDGNTFTWQATGREVGGRLLPNTPKVTIVRKPSRSTQPKPGKN